MPPTVFDLGKVATHSGLEEVLTNDLVAGTNTAVDVRSPVAGAFQLGELLKAGTVDTEGLGCSRHTTKESHGNG